MRGHASIGSLSEGKRVPPRKLDGERSGIAGGAIADNCAARSRNYHQRASRFPSACDPPS